MPVLVVVSQAALLEADQLQPVEVVVVTVKLPLPALELTVAVGGEAVPEQGGMHPRVRV